MIGPATHAFDLARTCWAWVQLVSDAQSVVAMRLMGLSGTWSVPAGETSEMIREKAPAFTEALVASTLSAVAGEGPNRVFQAALTPLSETARANRIRLARHGPKLIGPTVYRAIQR